MGTKFGICVKSLKIASAENVVNKGMFSRDGFKEWRRVLKGLVIREFLNSVSFKSK
jgi:hypothetical protein